jgi:hypothetical protein
VATYAVAIYAVVTYAVAIYAVVTYAVYVIFPLDKIIFLNKILFCMEETV